MLTITDHYVSETVLKQARSKLPQIDTKKRLNIPTGRFFYDKWKIDPEYVGTVWETILSSLPYDIGEARLIRLQPGTCYYSHSDIDDRWHMNIVGEKSFLIDIDNEQMHSTDRCGYWYSMDASTRHSAANFGCIDRVQLVVRKLLKNSSIDDGVKITVSGISGDSKNMSRYIFDDILSNWLNLRCKDNCISDVEISQLDISFILDTYVLNDFRTLVQNSKLNINYNFDY